MRRVRILIALPLLSACVGDRPADSRTIGIERLDPAIDALISPDAVIEILAEGFGWAEGPVWIEDGGYVLFSDVPTNRVYHWKEGEGARVWLEPSGYTGDASRGGEPGSNGLLLDSEGQLVLCQHGDRRVARLDAPMTAPAPLFITLADRYDGKRLSSPNDAVFDSRGALFFTDPPYGLPEGPGDPPREIPFSGVYRLGVDGEVTLLTDELSRPNGIALSPDEKTLYVSNSDPDRAIWMAYDVLPSGRIENGRVFFDATERVTEARGLPDGLGVDEVGNLFATGPGGVLVLSPDGRHLGTIRTTRATANVAFDRDRAALYITADDYLLRVRLR
jgi:gluconolactonase